MDTAELNLTWLRASWRPVVLAHVGAFALIVEERMKPALKGLEPFWTVTLLLAFPLGMLLVVESRTLRGRLIGALGASLAIAAPVARWAVGTRDAFTQHPDWLVVPALGALAIVGIGAILDLDRERWGLGLGDWRWWGPRAGALGLAIIPFVGLSAAMFPDLLAFYPSRNARGPADVFALAMLGRGVYFVAWEWFFRGFLVFGLAPATGAPGAIAIQAYPFLLLHRNKPLSEMSTSFTGAVVLGAFCWRARSVVPAILLHWWMNVSMELLGWLSSSA